MLSHLSYWSPKNWCQLYFFVSNKIQSIRQHYFEINKGLIFDYAILFVAYSRPTERSVWVNDEFWSIISFSLFKSIFHYFYEMILCFFLFDEL